MDMTPEIKKDDALEHLVTGQSAQQANCNMALQIESTNPTETYLHHLNDDCLLEIFSKNSLTPIDLTSLAATCKLFERITQRIFPKKLAIEHRGTRPYLRPYNLRSGDYHGNAESSQVVERIFKHFGSRLVTVDACGNYGCVTQFILSSVAKHCVVGTLEELGIEAMKISAGLAIKLKPFFRHLQLLCIDSVIVEGRADVFANCHSLIELRVRQVDKCNAILDSKFPKLQRFTFYRDKTPDDFDSLLLNFIECHQTLISLDLYTPRFVAMELFVRKLGNNCKELEELDITFCGKSGSVLDFSNFQSLKRLRLHCYEFIGKQFVVRMQNLGSLEVLKMFRVNFKWKQFLEALPSLTSLRELDVTRNSIKQAIQWSSLTQLTKLRLSTYSSDISGLGSVIDIIRALGNLEELEIHSYDFTLSEWEFSEIVTLVKGRSNVLTLKCPLLPNQSIDSYMRICDENVKVRLLKL